MSTDFQKRLQEKTYKRQFKLMNRVGQLGRQGIHGPAEQSEKRLLRAAQPSSSKTKAKNFKV